MSTLLNALTPVVGCGRTDTGVHAQSYYAHFDTDAPLPRHFVLRLNKMLPADIGVFNVRAVKDDAHARFDAESRTYKYFIHFSKDAALQDRSFWLHSYDFDLDTMNAAAARLCFHGDFSSFEKKGGDNATSTCTVSQAKWESVSANQWCFTVSANRFLRNMVRRMTGALLMVGVGRISADELIQRVEQMELLEVTFAPPAKGLFLWEITYPESIWKKKS